MPKTLNKNTNNNMQFNVDLTKFGISIMIAFMWLATALSAYSDYGLVPFCTMMILSWIGTNRYLDFLKGKE